MTTFRDYYQQLPSNKEISPRQKFIKRISEITKKSEKTIRCWISGSQKPDTLTQSIIEKELNIPCDELFSEEFYKKKE